MDQRRQIAVDQLALQKDSSVSCFTWFVDRFAVSLTLRHFMKALSGIDLLGLQARLTLQRTAEGLPSVLDPVRRKYVRATPEEMVRQLWILYFLEVMQLNPKLIAVERSFTFNTMVRRFDLVIFGKTLEPVMLAEFKSPGTEINQSVFDQVARYNMELHVPLALISNGRTHYVFQMEKEHPGFHFLDTLPLPLL